MSVSTLTSSVSSVASSVTIVSQHSFFTCSLLSLHQVTKNKTWKEIAVLMGIGGSSSGAYTLRKHYMKHLIFFECQFERGGMDPAPILAKYEIKSNKKKGAASPGAFTVFLDRRVWC